MMPLVPGITTGRASIERTVRAIADAGVPLLGSNVAHLEAGVREHFFRFLEREYPQLLAGYGRLYARNGYAPRDYAVTLRARVRRAAEEAGLRERERTG
jgi:DNA repair photolyase